MGMAVSMRVADTPISVVDVETTGFAPKVDRIVEVSVVRMEPGRAPELVFDSLVNPQRPVAAVAVHGITDADVVNAPAFREIAGDLVRAMADSVVSAYNAPFDIRFLTAELQAVGVPQRIPHFCLMRLRENLRLGRVCKLGEACREAGIHVAPDHRSGTDAMAAAILLESYLPLMARYGLLRFGDLGRHACKRRGQAVNLYATLMCSPLGYDSVVDMQPCGVVKPRTMQPACQSTG